MIAKRWLRQGRVKIPAQEASLQQGNKLSEKPFTGIKERYILAALFYYFHLAKKDMSWLGNLFGVKPYQHYVDKEFNDYKDFIDEIVYRENERLRSLGIEPPRLISEMDYKKEIFPQGIVSVDIFAPKFALPAHLHFFIYWELSLTLHKNLELAEKDYLQGGLGNVVNKPLYRPIWTNREPFEFYRLLQMYPSIRLNCHQPGDLTALVRRREYTPLVLNIHFKAEDLASLQSVVGLSNREAVDLHNKIQLFNDVTVGRFEALRDPQTYYNAADRRTFYFYEDIVFLLPIPSTQIDAEYSSIKILPSGEVKSSRVVEFLNSLRPVNHFVSFELIREKETVSFRLRFPTDCESRIIPKLELYFPDFELLNEKAPEQQRQYTINSLKKESAYSSIRRLRDFQVDPYAHFASVFDAPAQEDLLCYQIVFAPICDAAATTIKELIARKYDIKDYSDKFARRLPLWMVTVSISSTNENIGRGLAQAVATTLNSPEVNFTHPESTVVENAAFPMWLPLQHWSLYDTDELAALAHFPISPLPMERLEKLSMRNVRPPEAYTVGDTKIGASHQRGQTFWVTLPENVRDRHVYVVGKSGTGKSTLIETIARADIENGGGIAVIDPHGDMIAHLLEIIPERRVADCILFSPKLCPISLEILSAENEHEIDLLTDDLITMFRRTSESWGDKMQAILQMTFQTLLRVKGSSFTDITTFLTDEGYRKRILSKIDHPQLESFWEHRYDMRQAEPILIRLDRLTTSSTLRQVLTQNRNSLNFYDVVTEGKIFLADLSKGFLGESTSHLLGSIIVSQIQLAAMRQAQLPMEQRVPFSLFVDEVQNFTTDAFSTILSEARKQKLRLTIAHQFVSQLPTEIQKAVFGNVGTLVFFALSPDDLGAARHELGTFEASDVANLPKYHALCRPATAAKDTFSFMTAPPLPAPARNFTKEIIELTRFEYGAAGAAWGESEEQSAGSTRESRQAPPPPPENDRQSEQSRRHHHHHRRPAPAVPLSFATNTEKILHFIRKAEYLSQPQIIALTGLQPSNASTALKKLVDTGQIKTLDDRRPKIYFVGRSCNATTHNLLVRDLFVKIHASNFAVRSVKFNDQLSELNPDLAIEFIGEDNGAPLLCYFELDRGTEGVQELVRKAERYARIPETPPVGFIFEREQDLQLARRTIQSPFVSYALLGDFSSLADAAFYSDSESSPAGTIKLPFFR